MAHIPKDVLEKTSWIQDYLTSGGLELIHQGKVRDTYRLDENHLLVYISDRISSYDRVFNGFVPYKGQVLTVLIHFFATQVMDYPNHLVLDINGFNAAIKLRERFPLLPIEQCLVVEDMTGKLDNFELIIRMCPGGSIWKEYLEFGTIASIQMPKGMTKWQRLEAAMFTPSTKESVGHDVNKTAQYYFDQVGPDGERFAADLLDLFNKVSDFLKARGIMMLDTKFEGSSSLRKLADEFFTPDSSRFCELSNWEAAVAKGEEPEFLDKQVFRDYVQKIVAPFKITSIGKLPFDDGHNDEYAAFIDSCIIPDEILKQVSNNYLLLVKRITGMEIQEYKEKKMGIIG